MLAAAVGLALACTSALAQGAPPRDLIVVDGDSITQGHGLYGSATYAAGLAMLVPGADVENAAVSGKSCSQLATTAPTRVDSRLRAGAANTLIVWCGTNDIAVGGATADAAFYALHDYTEARRAAGWRVVVVTMLPRAASPPWPAITEAQRGAFNGAVRGTWSRWADGLADVAADPRIGSAGRTADPVYYQDAAHPTAVGAQIAAGIVAAAIERMAPALAPMPTRDWTPTPTATPLAITGPTPTAAPTEDGMTTLTLQPDATAGVDTWLAQSLPTTNLGTNALFLIGGDGANASRALIKFDLSSLPSNAVISSATLSIYATVDEATTASTIRVYRQIRAWTEAGATWNTYDGSTSWQTAGGFGALDCEQTDIGSRATTATETVNAFKDILLTPTTKAGLDLGNGWLIKTDNETLADRYRYSSSDAATAANRPKLVIVYTVPSSTPAVMQHHHSMLANRR